MALIGVLVDQREPPAIQTQNYGAPSTVTLLDCGDLWATTDQGDLIICERKTPSDLLGSIEDGRIFEQMARCRERSPWAYLVVTGALAHSLDGHVVANGRVTRWRWRDVQGALLSMQEAGAGVVYCTDDAEFAATVQWLARRERVAEKVIQTRAATRVLTIGEQLLTALPGIGLQRAQALLCEFADNPAWALVWLTQPHAIGEVVGIGAGTKRNVRAALQMDDDQELCIAPLPGAYGEGVETVAPLESRLAVPG